MRALRWAILAAVAVVLAGFVFLAATAPKAKAQQSAKGAWYQSLTQPITGRGCCSESDCAVSPAKMIDGEWYVPAADRIVQGHWVPVQPLNWVRVPPEVILTDKQSFDGISAYVCWVQGQIFCFVKGEAGG